MSGMGTLVTRATGALLSGKRAAYMGILLKILKPVAAIVDTILFTRSHLPPTSEFPPILFLVSPPRSGSTLIYQVLVRNLTCVHFSNLHYLMPKAASKIMYKSSEPVISSYAFNNYYGYTARLYDVNEGNEVFDRLFEGTDPKMIRKRFLAYLEHFRVDDRPVIFKNVRNYKQLMYIKKALPEIHFIRIHRGLSENVQSELRAYRELKTFHPIPDELLDKDYHGDPVEFAFNQITSIYNSIADQLGESDCSMMVSYESFCNDPAKWIARIARFAGIEKKFIRSSDQKFDLTASSGTKVSESDKLRIDKLVAEREGIR